MTVRARERYARAAMTVAAMTVAATLACALALAAPAEAATSKVYTVGNYPVEARAGDAIAAKSKAIADGQKAAFRSLLKRIVPVKFYARLKKLSNVNVAHVLDGTAVRSERNSSTQYIANLDFIFNADGVKALLLREGIPQVDAQASQITVVPVWNVPAATAGLPTALATGGKAWLEAWKGLDLVNALTPVKVEATKPDVLPETIAALASGDTQMVRTFASSYGSTDLLVVAIATPDMATKRLGVTLIGQDAVGALAWTHAYRIDPTDATYTIELAGAISLHVLEGRYKAVNGANSAAFGAADNGNGPSAMPAAFGGPPAAGVAAGGSLQFGVEFQGMAEWQSISRKLSAIPDVQDLDVAGLSNRGARVVLRYPGGMAALADAASQQGLSLRGDGAAWVLSSR